MSTQQAIGRAHWTSMLPLIQAYLAGKTIQTRFRTGYGLPRSNEDEPGQWRDVDYPTFSDHSGLDWRVKP